MQESARPRSFLGRLMTPPITIDKKTSINLGVALAVAGSAIAFHAWLSSQFSAISEKIDSKFEHTTQQIRGVEDRLTTLELRQHHPWDSLRMKEWVLDLRRANPALVVPDVPERR